MLAFLGLCVAMCHGGPMQLKTLMQIRNCTPAAQIMMVPSLPTHRATKFLRHVGSSR
jgi:hypothetical protein